MDLARATLEKSRAPGFHATNIPEAHGGGGPTDTD